MFTTILVCSDGSKPALQGAYLAAQIARKFSARLLLLHVFDEEAAIKPFFNLWEQNIGRDENESDLIVLGSHGLDAVSSFLLGSVSDRVAHHAPCSVLVAR